MATKPVESNIIDAGTNGDTDNGLGIETVDPNTIGSVADDGGNSGGERKRGRGRPPKPATDTARGNNRNTSGSTRQNQTKNQSALNLDQVFYSMHLMMASALKIPELQLTDEESKRLANAIAEVNKHYDLSVDPKVMAWVALGTTMTGIYAPRIGAYKIRENLERKKKAEKLPEQKEVQENLQPKIDPLPMSVSPNQ